MDVPIAFWEGDSSGLDYMFLVTKNNFRTERNSRRFLNENDYPCRRCAYVLDEHHC